MSWVDPSVYIKKIIVEENCLEIEYTQEILQRAQLPYTVVGEDFLGKQFSGDYSKDLVSGKKVLVLTQNKGKFLKGCPATREYRCCDYYVLNTGMNCPIDCVYCILQAYLNNPWISFYTNIDKMFEEIDCFLDENTQNVYRIGTGEFTDSLALDRLTGLSSRLVEHFSKKTNGILELKTKSGFISSLEGLEHGGKTIVSWSLNSEQVMEKEEIRAASFDERLAAARKCGEWGYRLGFHFDPVILHKEWQDSYEKTIQTLFDNVPADMIAWISIGALRFLPDLKKIGSARFPKSTMFFQEFIEGLDGKSRYFRSARAGLYKPIYNAIKRRAAEKTCVYFCMESDEIWKEVTGFFPEEKGGLPAMLDEAVFPGK